MADLFPENSVRFRKSMCYDCYGSFVRGEFLNLLFNITVISLASSDFGSYFFKLMH